MMIIAVPEEKMGTHITLVRSLSEIEKFDKNKKNFCLI